MREILCDKNRKKLYHPRVYASFDEHNLSRVTNILFKLLHTAPTNSTIFFRTYIFLLYKLTRSRLMSLRLPAGSGHLATCRNLRRHALCAGASCLQGAATWSPVVFFGGTVFVRERAACRERSELPGLRSGSFPWSVGEGLVLFQT